MLWVSEILKKYFIVVVKAQLISDDSIQAGKSYQFPNDDDDLTNFTGRTAQIMFSNDVLKGVLDQIPSSECYWCSTFEQRTIFNASSGLADSK